ncbi:hypothetical protein LSCM1_07979 [Leishmania martiniquensis]|uniref:Uncharacterized protein n=1 Tax=Leishmania martiniquensis TaxID=1580590 RepID=A0A836KXP2_9TRYP|nr:hypothetical protein LSCM1_07979 [Leishmania martiniquensis]
MIRVFAKRGVPVMDIIELQGKIVITQEALSAAREAQERRRELRRSGAANRDATVGAETSGTDDDAVSLSSAPSPLYASSDGSCSSSRSSTGDGGGGTRSGRATAGEGEDVHPEMRQRALRQSSASRGAVSPSCSSSACPRPPRSAAGDPAVVEVPLGHVEQDCLNEKRCSLCIDTLRVHGSRYSFKHPWLVLRECSPARMRRLRRQMARTQIPRDDTRARDLMAASGRGGDSAAVPETADGTPSSAEPTLLFSEWLRQHPEALSLDSLFLDDFAAGDGDERDACGSTKAGPTCAAPRSITRGSPADNAEQHKRPREESAADTAANYRSSSPPSQLSASRVPLTAPTTAETAYKNYELIGVVRDAVLFNSKPSRVFQ